MSSLNAIPLSRLWAAALAGGVVAAIVEMVFVLPIQAMLGNGPVIVFDVIAGGFLGKAAFQGGAGVFVLGVAIHLFVSVAAAAVYVFAARYWDDVLIRKPVISSMAFGAVCYVVMTFVVIPLSALGYLPNPHIDRMWMSIAIHILAFGLPIGLVARAVLGRPAMTAVSFGAS